MISGTLPAGTGSMPVFRFAGCVAFAGCSLALLQRSIRYERDWWTTVKSMSDGLLYGLMTSALLGWLWPR